jgi:predicted DNA-binding transcriptional regulator AlpA
VLATDLADVTKGFLTAEVAAVPKRQRRGSDSIAGEPAMSASEEHDTPHLTVIHSVEEAEPRLMSAGDLIDEPALATRLGVSRSTLQSWRYAGRGPRYIKLGRMIRYRNDDVEAYLRANTRGKVA